MRIVFPEGIDRLGQTFTQEEHNLTTDERSLRPSDLAQAIRAVMTRVGIRNSTDPESIEYRLTSIAGTPVEATVDLSGIESRLTVLEAAAGSSVSGTGTTNRLTMWSASNVLAAGPITVSGNDIALLGTLTFPSGPIAQTYDASTLRIGNSYIGTNLETSQLMHYSNIRVFNKAGSGWVTWATRNTAGSEAVMDLTSVSIVATGQIQTYDDFRGRANWALLNKAGSGWVTFGTRSTSGNEAVLNLSNVGTIGMYNTATGSTSNQVGAEFYLRNDAAATKLYGYIRMGSTKINAGAEGGTMNLAVLDNAGAMHTPLQVAAYGLIINKRTYMYEGGIDVINKAGNGWLAFVARNTSGTEAVLNLAAIDTITPTTNTSRLTIAGGLTATGYVQVSRNGSTFALWQNASSTQASRTNMIVQMKDSAGNWDDFAVIAGENSVYTNGAETGSIVMSCMSAGAAAASALTLYGTQYASFAGDVKLASGKKFYINNLPHTVVESASGRAPTAGVYDGGLGVNTHSSRSRFLLRGNSQWREVVTGHWERKMASSVSASTGTTLTFANAYPSGTTVMPLAFWEDADGNLNWCRLVRNLDEGTGDLLSVTAYPPEDGGTVHLFIFEPDAAQ